MSKKILIIDDDDDHLAVTSNLLRHIGKFAVVASTDSTAAMEIIRREKPDLILLDIMMPKVDGLSICKQVKESPDLNYIKVIVYSAKIFEVDRKNAMKVGADAYISKVIESGKLIDTINKILG
ncbi:response regulator [bacterium]|nr:response regulator [bacterium]